MKAASEKLTGDLKDQVKVAIEKYKPIIIEKLNEGKEVAISLGNNAKKVIIDIKANIVRIFADVKESLSDEDSDEGLAIQKRAISDSKPSLIIEI